jgi:NNP family nitrate/nitrite transporter-like MFS transporter
MASMNGKIETLEREIAALHKSLEARGVNSTGVTDIYGRRFPVPVDSEHKATQLFSTLFKGILPNAPQPHMYAFWVSAFGFFCTFFSVFAPAALMPYIRRAPEDGGIGLSPIDIADSDSAAVGGTIVMRVIAGPLCDMIGARRTFFLLLWLGVPGIVIFAVAQNAAGLIAARLLIGLSLATFVTCQVWCSQMFTRAVVGTANATAGGWGNLGGGVTQLVMPYVMLGFMQATGTDGPGINTAWRLCMVVPAALHVISSVLVIMGRDLPDGNYKELETSGAKQKAQGGKAVLIGFSNVNAWILTITYGFCFGVELTMNNKAVLYFYRYYGVSPQIAGVLGSCFGLMNLFARSWGGMLSDLMNSKFGMRGRIWAMWIFQSLNGLMCLVMGLVTINMPSPDRKVICAKCPLPALSCSPLMCASWVSSSGPLQPAACRLIPSRRMRTCRPAIIPLQRALACHSPPFLLPPRCAPMAPCAPRPKKTGCGASGGRRTRRSAPPSPTGSPTPTASTRPSRPTSPRAAPSPSPGPSSASCRTPTAPSRTCPSRRPRTSSSWATWTTRSACATPARSASPCSS